MLVLAISGCHDNHQHQVGGSLGTVLSLCQETKSFGIEWTGWRQFYQGGAGWLCWRSFTPPDPCWLKGDEVATEWSKLVPTSTTIIQPLRPPPSLGWVTSLSIKCCKICSSETGWPDRTVVRCLCFDCDDWSDWTHIQPLTGFYSQTVICLAGLLQLDRDFFFIRSIEGEDDRATRHKLLYYA